MGNRTREKVLGFVRRRLLAGEPPTVREVQDAMGFASVESARKHLEALVRDGRLRKQPGRARGYRLPAAARGERPPVMVPLLGEVPAGDLRAALEMPEGWIAVQSRVPPEELFALAVRGDSMTGAGILDGDVVVVRRQATAQSGDVVVALVGEEATVKTLRRRGRRIVLAPENPKYRPLVPEEVRILGKVIEVRRRMAGS